MAMVYGTCSDSRLSLRSYNDMTHLSFPFGTLSTLQQITLISLRILVGYAKSTHRNLAQLCRVPYQPRPATAASSSAETNDDGASMEQDTTVRGSPPLLQVDLDEEGGCDDRSGLPWDPLAPRLLQEAQRLAREGKQKPFTAAVVLAAALPFSGCAVLVGAPVLAGDAALQWGASTPVGRTVGQGAKNAMEVRLEQCGMA